MSGSITISASGTTLHLVDGVSYIITGSNDTVTLGSGVTVTIQGTNDSLGASGQNDVVNIVQAGNSVSIGGNNDTVTAVAGDTAGFSGTDETLIGNNDVVYETAAGASVTVAGNNDTVSAVAGDTTGFSGTGETLIGNNDVVYETAAGTSVTVAGNNDTVGAVAGDVTGFTGTGEGLIGNSDIIYMDNSSASVTVFGNSDVVNSAYSGNVIGFAGNADTAQINNGLIYLDNGATSVAVEGSGDTVNSAYSGNSVGFTGANDIAQVSNGTIDVNNTGAGSLTIQGSGNSETIIGGTTQNYPVLDAQTIASIDAIDNAVLDRGAASSDLISAQIVLANGGGLAGVMSAVANSAEARSDMASTYAAIGAAGPSQAEFNAFADAMSTSYGAPIELVSVDPGSGQQTELADTGITNLLAELPVLETTANGVNLGLRLADGTQVRSASTAGLADFLYATAVQQMQATSFVTDNFNLDVQWLNTVDQPLLNEAVWWNEHATALRALGGANYDQQAVEANTMASPGCKSQRSPRPAGRT